MNERNEIISVLSVCRHHSHRAFFAHSLPSPHFVFVVVFIVVVVVACSVNSYLDSPALSPLAVVKNGHI